MADRRIELINELARRTQNNSLKWTLSNGNKLIGVQVGKNSVYVSQTIMMNPEEPDYSISLYDSNQKLVEQFTDVQLFDETEERIFTTIHEMFRKAVRQALGADVVLDDILANLRDEGSE